MFMKQKLFAQAGPPKKRPLRAVLEQPNIQKIGVEKAAPEKVLGSLVLQVTSRRRVKVRPGAKLFNLSLSVSLFTAQDSVDRHGKTDTVVENVRPGITGAINRFAPSCAVPTLLPAGVGVKPIGLAVSSVASFVKFLASHQAFSTARRIFYPTGSETVNTRSSFSCVSF